MLIASETFLALCSLAIFSLSSAKTSISSSLQLRKPDLIGAAFYTCFGNAKCF